MKRLSTLLCVLIYTFVWALAMTSPTRSLQNVHETSDDDNYPTVWLLGEMGIPQDDTENQIGYRPDLGIKMSTSDGNIYTATVHFFNIAGDPIHNFGFCAKETLAANPADWGSINDYRIGAAEPETAVYYGQPLKIGEMGISKENFFKISTGTYLVTLNLSQKTMTATPTTAYTHLYIMGNGVKGQTYAANTGTELNTADGKIFKKEVTFEANVGENATFTFSTLLGANADSWDAIADYRFGATSDNYAIELDKETALGTTGNSKNNHFNIAAGTYEMTINMETMTMKLTSQQFAPLYVMGRVTGQVWAANQGTPMETKDGNIYTLRTTFQHAEEKTEATFGFTTKLAGSYDWNQIADYRIGYIESYGDDGYPVLYGKKMKLGQQGKASKENFFAVQNGEYVITVNLAEQTCQVVPVNQSYDILYVMGNTVITDNGGNKKYQVWAADQGTQLYTHDFKTYSGQVSFEDEHNNTSVGFSFTTKLGADFTKWDDIASSRFGAQSANTHVTLDTDILCGNYLDSKENQFIIPIGTYDLSVNLETRTLRVSKTPYTPVYILGRVAYDKDNSWYWQPWSSKQGLQLDTNDGETYTGTIHVEDDMGNAYVQIGFSTKLSKNEGDWDGIAANRFAATSDGGEYLPFNVETQCGDFLSSKENHFKVRRGTYNISLNLTKRTVKVEPASNPVIYVIGTIEGKDFVANQGTALTTTDGKIYQGNVTFTGDDAQFVLSDKLSTSEDGWTDIEKYTFGPENDQTPISEQTENTFGAYANAWSVNPNTYQLTVNLPNNTLTLSSDPNVISGIAATEYDHGLKVYPTLTSGNITIEHKKHLEQIDIYSTSGKLMYHTDKAHGLQHNINVSAFPSGVYLLKVANAHVVKIIKK